MFNQICALSPIVVSFLYALHTMYSICGCSEKNVKKSIEENYLTRNALLGKCIIDKAQCVEFDF